MPSSSRKQANAARLAGAVKTGDVSSSKVNPSIRKMAEMPMDKLRHFMRMKENLSVEGKKKLLFGLKLMKRKLQKENSLTLSPMEPMYLEDIDNDNNKNNIISKKFTVNGDFDQYVNKNRGIEFGPKESESISNFSKKIKPTDIDPFFVRFENTDEFGNNTTMVIKKFLEGQQFVFVAFAKYDQSIKPEEPENKEQNTPEQNDLDNNKIIITKTTTFRDDSDGAGVLSSFLEKLDI